MVKFSIISDDVITGNVFQISIRIGKPKKIFYTAYTKSFVFKITNYNFQADLTCIIHASSFG